MLRNITLFAMVVLASAAAWAGPGHDHGPEAAAPVSNATPRLESVGSTMELVATAQGHRLILYLDHRDTNEPIDDAVIEVSGEEIPTALAKRVEPGTYELEADWVDQPGTKALIFTITTSTDVDLLNGTWRVAEDQAGTSSDAAALPLLEVLSRSDVLGVLIGALAFGFVLAFAWRNRRHRKETSDTEPTETARPSPSRPIHIQRAAEAVLIAVVIGTAIATSAIGGPGHDHGGDHSEVRPVGGGNTPHKLSDGRVFVPKVTQRLLDVRTQPATVVTAARTQELIGTIVPDPSAFGVVQAPMDGQIDVATHGIAYPGQKVKAGDVLALLSPAIPVADLGTLQQLRAEVDGKLRIAEQKLDRLMRIASVVARSQIEDTQAELAALREQKRVLESKDTQKIELTAPVSGIVSVVNIKAGQVVSARDTLIEIVNPDRLWIEAIGDAGHSEGQISSAQAVDSAGHVLDLSYVGRSPTLRYQARPYLFRITAAHPDLAIGAAIQVVMQSEASIEGVVVPRGSVVRGTNGISQVWIKDGPELFRSAEVKTQPLDGERLLVVGGIRSKERIVTMAAELLNQIR